MWSGSTLFFRRSDNFVVVNSMTSGLRLANVIYSTDSDSLRLHGAVDFDHIMEHHFWSAAATIETAGNRLSYAKQLECIEKTHRKTLGSGTSSYDNIGRHQPTYNMMCDRVNASVHVSVDTNSGYSVDS